MRREYAYGPCTLGERCTRVCTWNALVSFRTASTQDSRQHTNPHLTPLGWWDSRRFSWQDPSLLCNSIFIRQPNAKTENFLVCLNILFCVTLNCAWPLLIFHECFWIDRPTWTVRGCSYSFTDVRGCWFDNWNQRTPWLC